MASNIYGSYIIRAFYLFIAKPTSWYAITKLKSNKIFIKNFCVLHSAQRATIFSANWRNCLTLGGIANYTRRRTSHFVHVCISYMYGCGRAHIRSHLLHARVPHSTKQHDWKLGVSMLKQKFVFNSIKTSTRCCSRARQLSSCYFSMSYEKFFSHIRYIRIWLAWFAIVLRYSYNMRALHNYTRTVW